MPRRPIPTVENTIGRYRPSIAAHRATPPGFLTMDNCWAAPRSDGVVENVPGYSAITSAASEDLRGLIYGEASDGTKLLLAVGATKLFSVSLADATFGAFTELATGLTYTNNFGYFIYDDAIYLFNGTAPKKITIASPPVVSTPGLTRPDATTWESEGGLASALNGAGNVHGIVKYYISEVAAKVESALSPAWGEIDTRANPKKIQLTFDPTALTTPSDMENKDFRIYRSFADGTAPFYVDTIQVATTSTTFDDDKADDELGDPPLHHGDPPPNGLLPVVTHLDRAWGAVGSDLYYSDTRKVESFFVSAAGNLISVFKDDGDEITALGSSRQGLLIWKTGHMYILLGKIEEEYVLERITQSHEQTRNIGTPSTKTVTAIPGGFAFYWQRAVYTYTSRGITRISTEVESEFNKNLDRYETEISIGYDSFNGRIWVSLPIQGTFASHTYFYSFRLGHWVGRMSRGFKGFQYVEDENTTLRFIAAGTE